MKSREVGEVRYEKVCREGRPQRHLQKRAHAQLATEDAFSNWLDDASICSANSITPPPYPPVSRLSQAAADPAESVQSGGSWGWTAGLRFINIDCVEATLTAWRPNSSSDTRHQEGCHDPPEDWVSNDKPMGKPIRYAFVCQCRE